MLRAGPGKKFTFVRHAITFQRRRLARSCAYRRNQPITACLHIQLSRWLDAIFPNKAYPPHVTVGLKMAKTNETNFFAADLQKSWNSKTADTDTHTMAANTQNASMALSHPLTVTHKRDRTSSPVCYLDNRSGKWRLFLNFTKRIREKMQKKPGPLCDSRNEALAGLLDFRTSWEYEEVFALILAGEWVCATHSVTQPYGADGAEVFFLFANKFIRKCFALVSFEYEPYSVSPPYYVRECTFASLRRQAAPLLPGHCPIRPGSLTKTRESTLKKE